MFRFFTRRNHIKLVGAASIILPLISTIILYQSKKDLGSVCVIWFIDACIALAAGYYIKDERLCRLKHFPENIGIEQPELPTLTETIEIEPSQLPALTEIIQGEPSQIEGTQTIQMTRIPSRIS